MTFGAKVYHLRKMRNLSRSKLARRIYVSLHTVKEWEKQPNRLPRLDTAVRLAKAFNLTLNELLEGVEL
jgi:transcriptional regulator with XRE-family HTH domain